jgi:nitrate/nitrite transporter NarK
MAKPAAANLVMSSFAWRLGFLYAALFLVVGCYLPHLPVWLNWRALDADQIALLLATPLYARILFTPTISFVADLIGDRRTIPHRACLGLVALLPSPLAVGRVLADAARHVACRQLDHDHAPDRDSRSERYPP